MTELELEPIWQSLLEATPITLALLDHERRVRYVNLVEHGFDRNAVLGVPIDGLLPAADRARITGLIDEVLQTGAPRTYETRLATPKGLVLYFVQILALFGQHVPAAQPRRSQHGAGASAGAEHSAR